VTQLESKPPASPEPPAEEGWDEIASAEIDVAPAPAPRRERHVIRDAIWVTMLVLAASGGLAAAYFSAETEPAPSAEVDPELAERRARLARARSALEEGHRLALEGASGADAAIAAYRRALEAAPELSAAERGLAIAFSAKGDTAEAVTHYRRYLELEPDAKDAAEVREIIEAWEKRSP
jgi:tetratricopeptide (TPR) repeat protein